MEAGKAENSASSGYGKGPPWIFRGSALYQLHLVKADVARFLIPKELRLVEAFGYTLGGFFLAHYDDSPAGRFDELVVIPGIVWNPPTSCAWASRVLVSSLEACRHGRKHIGLPSHFARFAEQVVEASKNPPSERDGFLNMFGVAADPCKLKDHEEIQVIEIQDSAVRKFCNIKLPSIGIRWLGPTIKMSLPSFSGRTEHNSHLLKYSCQIACRVRAVESAMISRPATAAENSKDRESVSPSIKEDGSGAAFSEDYMLNLSVAVLLSKPILALQLNSLRMQVEAPTIASRESKKEFSKP